MASKYANLFEYESFRIVMNTCMIEYTCVTLLNQVCGKKPGDQIDRIVLNPADGSWSIPVKTKKKPLMAPVPKKSNIVEFKGVHTRFEDSDESLDKEQSRGSGDDLEYIPNDVKSSTFKVFQGRKRVTDTWDLYDEFSKYIYDLGSGSKDTIAVNAAHGDGLIRVAGIDLEPQFELKKRYKLPFGNYSIVRIY